LGSKKRILLVLLLVVVAAGVFVLYRHYDPTHSQIAPKCIVKSLTGYSCPSCGLQRQLYNFTHLRFADGLACNYFLPFGFLYFAVLLFGDTGRLRSAFASRYGIAAFVVLYVAWGIARNVLGV
jgi:hypothetical protein